MTCYSTTDPDTVKALLDATQALHDFAVKVCADAEQLGNNKGVRRSGGLFGHIEVAGLAPDDPENPPEGWRYLKGRDILLPRRGKAWESARRWMSDHEAPKVDVRGVLSEHGLPRYSTNGSGDLGGLRIDMPGIFHHDGTVWANYSGRPCNEPLAVRDEDYAEPDERWMLRRDSEWHAAREALEAAG